MHDEDEARKDRKAKVLSIFDHLILQVLNSDTSSKLYGLAVLLVTWACALLWGFAGSLLGLGVMVLVASILWTESPPPPPQGPYSKNGEGISQLWDGGHSQVGSIFTRSKPQCPFAYGVLFACGKRRGDKHGGIERPEL